MIAVKHEDYRRLELDSSNLLMQWDGKWGLGWYEEAASAVLKAGEMRRRMAQMCFEAGDFEQAAADSLSSAACFFAATAADRAKEQLGIAQQLEADSRIPPKRKDILAALREREAEVDGLAQKLREFDSWLTRMEQPPPSGQSRLQVLLGKVREFPGLERLHRLIRDEALKT